MNGIDLTHEAPAAPDVVAAGLEAGLVLNATGPHTLPSSVVSVAWAAAMAMFEPPKVVPWSPGAKVSAMEARAAQAPEAGLVLSATRPHTLRFLPPLICTTDDVDVLVERLRTLL